ncbi:MAG: isoprenylcysteine carboxylmethyltransferase family protein [Anaerolineales bacterium]
MSSETTLRLIAFLLIVSIFSISGYYRRNADRSDKRVGFEAENSWLLRLRTIGALVFYIGMLVYLIYPPLIAWASVPGWPLALRWIGVALMATVLPLLIWMFRSLGTNITPTVKTRAKHELVVSGPYKYIRHPLYSFGSLFFLGFLLLAGNWMLTLGGTVALYALFARTPQEEDMLVEKFGDEYRDYMKRTGRYLPKLMV